MVGCQWAETLGTQFWMQGLSVFVLWSIGLDLKRLELEPLPATLSNTWSLLLGLERLELSCPAV